MPLQPFSVACLELPFGESPSGIERTDLSLDPEIATLYTITPNQNEEALPPDTSSEFATSRSNDVDNTNECPTTKDGVTRCFQHGFNAGIVYHFPDTCTQQGDKSAVQTLRERQVVTLSQDGIHSDTGEPWPAFENGAPLCLYPPGRPVSSYQHFSTCPTPHTKDERRHSERQSQQQGGGYGRGGQSNGYGVAGVYRGGCNGENNRGYHPY